MIHIATCSQAFLRCSSILSPPRALVDTLRQWSSDKSRDVSELFAAAGMLSPVRRDLVQAIVDERLRHYGGDSARCLAALSVSESLRGDLLLIADPDIAETLTRLGRSVDGPVSIQSITGDQGTATLRAGHSRGSAAASGTAESPTESPQRMAAPAAEATHVPDFDPYATNVHPSAPDLTGTRPAPSGTKPGSAETYLTLTADTQLPITALASEAVSKLEARSQSADRYRVLRLHAKGGLGLVSVAEDAELHREVALKEIQYQHADNPQSRARFLVEAEVTGRLEHPGIVPVYGLGRYADGRPYYAMRFIRGQSMRRAIEVYHRDASERPRDELAPQLELRGLLGRFIAVCDTMAYAHSRGILHRDLKPDNIMLGEYGETLVVDWGLAKVVGVAEEQQSAESQTIVLASGVESGTQAGSAVGTPQFMSPEQAAGRHDELAAASDIYSLGATLYQILTGAPPFDPTKLQTLLRQVREGKFPRPRARLKSIPPALEAICLKAMALRPEDRYATARSLATDLEHWLADEPVAVYRESWSQRLNRWGRRHKMAVQTGVAALAMILVLAVLFAVLINQSRQREATAKVEATQRSRQSREAVDALMKYAGQEFENFPGLQKVRERLLQRAAEDYEKLTKVENSDPELRAEAARAFGQLGDARTLLNQNAAAETAYRAGAGLWNELIAEFPDRAEFQVELAQNLTRRAIGASTAGRNSEAESIYGEALGILDPLMRSHPENASAGDALGTALVNLGRLQSDQARRDDAEQTLRRAVEAFERTEALRDASPRDFHALALARATLGRFLLTLGREQDAIPLFLEAITAETRLVESFPNAATYLSAQASCRIDLAAAYRDLGRFEDEVTAYRKSDDGYVRLLALLPDVPRYRENRGVALTNLGQVLHKLGQNPAALGELQRAQDILDFLASEFPSEPNFLEEVATANATLSSVARELAKPDDAQAFAAKSLLHYRQLTEALPDVVRYRVGLGVALALQARIFAMTAAHSEAETAFVQAIAELKQAIAAAPHDPHFQESLAEALVLQAWLRQQANDTVGCRAAHRESLQTREALVDGFPGSPRHADALAWLLANGPATELRDPAKAESLSTKTTSQEPLNDFYWRTLGLAQYRQGKYAESRTSLKKAYDLRPTEQGIAVLLLAMSEWQLGNKDIAQELLKAAVAWSDANKPGDDELLRVRDEAQKLIQ